MAFLVAARRRYAPASLRLLGWRRGTAPLLRGDPAFARSAPTPDRPGLAAPVASPSPRETTHTGYFWLWMRCGCLRYDTGPVSAALRPREPASLLCAIKRLSLLGGWINYLPYFQLRDPYSRLVTLLRCCSVLAARASVAPAHTSPSVPIISSSSSSIIRHLEWSWKLAFHPGVG